MKKCWWSINILIRILVYYSNILLQWAFGEASVNIYGSTRMEIPRPYFCCVYTGDRKNVSDKLSLRMDYAGDPNFPIDLKLRIIHNDGDGFLGQYIAAARMFTSEFRGHGYSRENAIKMIDECIKAGYLVDFMRENKVDIMDIMEIMTDGDFWRRRYEEGVQNEMNSLKTNNSKLANSLDKGIAKYLDAYQGQGMPRDEAKRKSSRIIVLRKIKPNSTCRGTGIKKEGN